MLSQNLLRSCERASDRPVCNPETAEGQRTLAEWRRRSFAFPLNILQSDSDGADLPTRKKSSVRMPPTSLVFPLQSTDDAAIAATTSTGDKAKMHRSTSAPGRNDPSHSSDSDASATPVAAVRSPNAGGRRRLEKRRSTVFRPSDHIGVHQYTRDPTVVWETLKCSRQVKQVRPMKLNTPVRPDAVRFVCLACTHAKRIDPHSLPPGDVLLVAGDFTTCGLPSEIRQFNEYLGQLKHTFKVVIAGNHEVTFDQAFMKNSNLGAKEATLRKALKVALDEERVSNVKSLLTNCIYLEDSLVELFGLRIYGSPWQPSFDMWGFNLERGTPLLDKWNRIPSLVDVLLTHTPPLGFGDRVANGERAGCVELLNSVSQRIHPKYHVFGHIHEGYGCMTDGYTKFINACVCDSSMRPTNEPIIFDLPLRANSKAHYAGARKKSSIISLFRK